MKYFGDKSIIEIKDYFLNDLSLVDISIFYILIFVFYKVAEHYFYLKKDKHTSMINRNILFISIIIYFSNKYNQYDDIFIILPSVLVGLLFLYWVSGIIKYIKRWIKIEEDEFIDNIGGMKKKDTEWVSSDSNEKVEGELQKIIIKTKKNIRFDFLLYIIIVSIFFEYITNLEKNNWHEYIGLYIILILFIKHYIFDVYIFDGEKVFPTFNKWIISIDKFLLEKIKK